jgi:serine/threonine protein kinase
LRHPNIAEILFAYEETYAHQYNLVFRFYPCDLDKILYNHSDASRLNITAQGGTPQQFLGSVLDHWLWKGLLGVVDAIANLHDPQNQHVPTPLNGRVVGGHFDIKPANFLIDYDCTLKLTDFGQAYLKSLAAGEEANMTAVPGTYNYSPPPRGSSRKLTIAYDIWSLACVLIEVINFILEEDDDATAKFFRERQNEDREHFAKFWRMNDEITQSSTRPEPVLKTCVTERLSKWKTLDDQYLTRVIRQIERMLPTSGTSSETAKACLQVFSASVTLDRYMFKSNADTLLGGPKTSKPFQRMRTTFTTEQVVNPLEFDLYVWRNRSKDEITILMEYQSNDGYKFLVPNSTKNTLEQFTPVTARTNPLLQFCFQNLHKAVRFYVPSRKDLYHLQGALTYQLPVEGSEIKFENCTFTTKGFKGKPSVQGAGHIQVWKELTESKHQERYEDESYASDRSSSDSGRAKGARQLTDVLRLALYVYASDSRPALILVMTLTENTNNLYFENTNGEAMMFIERSRYHDFFPLAILEADRDENNLPGIPFSPDILTKKIAAGKQIKELVVSFCNGQDQQKFRAFYDLCFSNS